MSRLAFQMAADQSELMVVSNLEVPTYSPTNGHDPGLPGMLSRACPGCPPAPPAPPAPALLLCLLLCENFLYGYPAAPRGRSRRQHGAHAAALAGALATAAPTPVGWREEHPGGPLKTGEVTGSRRI